ncbi:hypothetical protein HRR83_003895 [Exophiala dermatitidis]|nr:hypothetical protein HRR74_002721 [Exophiala dermatitidis]KAJ4529467.1 hypothetical protein HRR73_000490 [Exophiala dermatitidis]KAJ4543876.1 hypothetical protein HRR76_001937 [Exophiala dermatitidis]KAJ4599142.1 hypothetical protein HRR83_003895 [Exophiala dermatitidis]KAJ4680820.1 hypothetical protein HRR93_002110 [Exophiala dermatitidis]
MHAWLCFSHSRLRWQDTVLHPPLSVVSRPFDAPEPRPQLRVCGGRCMESRFSYNPLKSSPINRVHTQAPEVKMSTQARKTPNGPRESESVACEEVAPDTHFGSDKESMTLENESQSTCHAVNP